jgi:hypothetical protein
MEYKLRELKTSDIFKMSRILQKLDMKIDFKGKEQEQLGGEFIMAVIGNIYRAEDEISEFIGSLSGITADEFNEQPIADTIEMIKKVFALKGISGFFKQAGQLKK